jgi:hypothetical protein
MRFTTLSRLFAVLVVIALLVTTSTVLFAQETTGGLTGTIKDTTGAVVGNAHVVVTSANLVGNKALDTDSAGYYRFANLPPGSYAITVTAKGFKTVRRDGIVLEVGHLPTVDITLEVGAAAEVVEVTGAAPIIDVTTETTQTNVTQDVVQDVPHGRSFQSVIQFAPSARNEPLMGSTATNGTGGNAPGSTTNGSDHGFSIAGGSDAENSMRSRQILHRPRAYQICRQSEPGFRSAWTDVRSPRLTACTAERLRRNRKSLARE